MIGSHCSILDGQAPYGNAVWATLLWLRRGERDISTIAFMAVSGGRRPVAISSIAHMADATRSISTPTGSATTCTTEVSSFSFATSLISPTAASS